MPAKVKGKHHQKIRETEIDGTNWVKEHWKSLMQNYRRTPYFEAIAALLEPLYLDQPDKHLAARMDQEGCDCCVRSTGEAQGRLV